MTTGRRATGMALLALLVISRAAAAQAGERVRVVDAGRGVSGRLLRAVLATPHATRFADSGTVDLPRDTTFATTVLVLGGNVTVASHVRGDVIVVDGDLFLHPGAEIDGRAVAIGGCVYNSTLATVRGGRLCFRENTFLVARTASGETTLSYRERRAASPRRLYLAGFRGFQPPGYDRVNGLSLGWGPAIVIDTGRLTIEPRVTYRSDLGRVDPAVQGRAQLGRRSVATVAASRGTFTNDAWIRSDIVNGLSALAWGTDARNYYRADRLEARLTRAFEGEAGRIELFGGGLTERARSVDPDSTSRSAPFSFFGRHDRREGMLRPNPQGTEGRITSAVVGAAASLTREDLTGHSAVSVEVPVDVPGGGRFVQATLDAATNFQTFGTHRVHAAAHAVLSVGDATPRQRYSYLGGSGTLATEELLELGGDELLYVDAMYSVPIERIRLPLVGSPEVGLRYAAGSAGVHRLPNFTQNVGLRLVVSVVHVDVLVDPATGHTNFGLGVAIPP